MLHRPGEAVGAAEVVGHEIDRLLHSQGGEELVDEARHRAQAEIEAGRNSGTAEPGQIGNETTEMGTEHPEHPVPEIGGVRIAVHQQDGTPFADLADVDLGARDRDLHASPPPRAAKVKVRVTTVLSLQL